MADYWKSQDRKYCDFCKCWIADNKPSREFHDNGKRHQENIKKRLKSISRSSAQSHKEQEKADEYFKQMETAALEAYRKDVERNADLTSRAINEKIQQENLIVGATHKTKVWHQLTSAEGQTYYWNTVTNETRWDVPEEGFLSAKEQKEEADKETAQKLEAFKVFHKKDAVSRIEEEKRNEEEERAKLQREKMKERRVKEPSPPPVYGPLYDTRKSDAYGRWETIQHSETNMEQQIPETSTYECPEVYEPDPTVKEFKEKTAETSEDLENTTFSFKKRKIPTGAKRNMRQRLDND